MTKGPFVEKVERKKWVNKIEKKILFLSPLCPLPTVIPLSQQIFLSPWFNFAPLPSIKMMLREKTESGFSYRIVKNAFLSNEEVWVENSLKEDTEEIKIQYI